MDNNLEHSASTGALVWIHGIHNDEPYSWGWAMIVEEPARIRNPEKFVKVWKVLFRGKLVSLREEEFTQFAWYNRHLFNEKHQKMVP